MQDFISWQKQTGEPITVNDTTLTPQTQVLQLRFPGGGYVWNRPLGVQIARNGRVENMPVIDVTRYALWTFTALTIFLSFIAFLSRKNK